MQPGHTETNEVNGKGVRRGGILSLEVAVGLRLLLAQMSSWMASSLIWGPDSRLFTVLKDDYKR